MMLFGTETFELEILKSIQNIFGCGFLDFIMPKISFLGNIGAIWIISGFALAFSKKYRKVGFAVLIGLLVAFLIGNVFMKNFFERPRPCWIDSSVHLLIPVPTDFSFPSGHTLSSFVSAFLLQSYNKKFGCPALILACIMAFSRLYLFMHFPSDILGGILLAFIISKVIHSKKIYSIIFKEQA